MAVVDADSTVEAIKAEFPYLTPAELSSLPHVVALLDKLNNAGVAVDTTALQTLTGAVTETAPATDIASSGLNGRLQRIAQRLTSLIALVPAALAADGGFKVSEVAPTNAGANSATNVVVKASAGILYSAQGFNNKASSQYIQIHDASSLPADAAVPVAGLSILVPATSQWAFDFGPRGRAFATGIVICNSSTLATKTIGSADCSFDAQYT